MGSFSALFRTCPILKSCTSDFLLSFRNTNAQEQRLLGGLENCPVLIPRGVVVSSLRIKGPLELLKRKINESGEWDKVLELYKKGREIPGKRGGAPNFHKYSRNILGTLASSALEILCHTSWHTWIFSVFLAPCQSNTLPYVRLCQDEAKLQEGGFAVVANLAWDNMENQVAVSDRFQIKDGVRNHCLQKAWVRVVLAVFLWF